MAEKSDLSPEASTIKAAQKARLRRLRMVVAPSQMAAAEASGVSHSSWNRMEVGDNEVDAIALARFCEAFDVPSEYVITGNLSGFGHSIRSQGHLRRLVEVETGERMAAREAAAIADTGGRTAPQPSGRSRKTHILDTQKA